MAVPSVKPGLTVSPPGTARSSFTVKTIGLPSPPDASPIVSTAGVSSSRIVPVAVSVAVTVAVVPETVRLTVNVSLGSSLLSSVVATVKDFVSPAVPAKLSAAVFSR